MYQIIPNLYLASYNEAEESAPSGFFMINCTKNLPMIRDPGIRFPIDDDKHPSTIQYMSDSFHMLVNLIQSKIDNGQHVVVHCQAGQQRSAAVVAAYLMKTFRLTTDQAISYIKSKKPDAFFWGVNFMDALNQWEFICNHISEPKQWGLIRYNNGTTRLNSTNI